MTTDTHTTPTRRWYVSDTPAVGDVLVHGTAYGRDANEQAEASVWAVVRTNHSTGRGTVQHATSGRKLQVVRGRFGWSLADGTARPVRFAQPPRETSEPTAPACEAVLLDEPVPAAAESSASEDDELDALAAELGADVADTGGWVQYLADLACSGDRSVALLPDAALEGALGLSGSALATRAVWAASERLLALAAQRAARPR